MGLQTIGICRAALCALFLGFATLAGAGVNSFTLTGPEGANVWAIAAQPGHPEVVLASTSRGIYRSSNGGVSWTLVSSQTGGDTIAFDPSAPDRVYVLGTQLHRSLDAGLTFAPSPAAPTPLAYLTVSGNRIYVASYQGAVYRSDDGAQSWTQLTVPWPASPSQAIIAIAAAPTDENVLYACAVTLGTYKTVDGGDHWTGPVAGSPCTGQFNVAWSLAVSPLDADRIVAATSDGMYLSTTGGAGWSVISPLIHAEWVYFDPAAPNNVVAISQIGSIARSTDGGSTWPTYTPWQNVQHARMNGGGFSGVAGHFYVAAYAGPMFSSDNLSNFTLRVSGMHAATVRDVISADDGTIYAMQTAGSPGLWRRTPGSWLPLDNDELRILPNNELRLNGIATAAEQSSLVYVLQADRLLRSNNRGVDWNDHPASITRQPITVTVDPTNPLVAYVSTYSGSVMRTANGGLAFTNCSGTTSPPFNFMRVDRASPNIIYAIGSYAPYIRLYRSEDSCQTWNPVTPEFPYILNDLVIYPEDHDTLYLVSLDRVLRSRNRGVDWTPLRFADPHGENLVAGNVLIDPVMPETIWVTAISAEGFARSVDDGATWQHVQIPGTGFLPVYSGVLDPLMPDTLVAGADSWGLVEYTAAPDLEVTLDVPADPWPAGASTPATVSVRNLGPLDASAPEITLSAPSSIHVTTVPANCTVNAGTVRCRLAPVHVDEVLSIPLVLTPTAAAASADLTATVTGHETDPVAPNNTITKTVAATIQVDMRVALVAAAATVDHGAVTRVTATASNQGASPAADSTLTFSLTGFTAPTLTPSRGSCTSAASPVCALGTLAPGETVTVTLDLTASALGVNSLSAQLQDVSAQFMANQSQAVTARPVGDASVLVADSVDPALRDTGYQYTATVRNVSGDTAPIDFAAIVTGATVASATSAGGTCTNTASTVTCALTSLGAGASTIVTINASSATAGTASLSATVTYGGTDSAAANNTASATTTINAPAATPPPRSGGGGGRFDWLVLGLLGLLFARQISRGRIRGSALR